MGFPILSDTFDRGDFKVNKAEFLQEKITFLIRFPGQDDLAFYQYFVKQHPDETIGWLYLGREWEKRGKAAQALKAYRSSLHSKQSDFSDEAREAYQRLLREQKLASRHGWLRRSLASLLLLLPLLLFPIPLGESPQQIPQYAATPKSASSVPAADGQYSHVEVIAVPEHVPVDVLKDQIHQILRTRRPALTHPFTLMLVPEADGVPLFQHLPFYQPNRVKAVLRYDPLTHSLLSQKWFDQSCACAQDAAVQQARKDLHAEQRTLEQVLILRNSLYRTYQRKGRLPLQLGDLAGGYPANALPAIPLPLAAKPGGGQQEPAQWRYDPAAFRPERAWESMSEVLPLFGYPEPAVPLQPLQIQIHQASHAMTMMSGPHLVRRYPIGIGKNQLTPEGYFTILQKINRPRGHDNVYGTRGLVFSSSGHAIHGTNNPNSIGKSQSLGCIRMHNADVEELYSFVSPGTDVIISDKQAPVRTWANPPLLHIPAGPEEETPKVVYHWLN